MNALGAVPGAVDLNADLGEEITDDAGLLALVSSANVACGGHAGTPAIMRRVCEMAAHRGVAIGAHVSYLDRVNFGRLPCEVEPATLRQQVADQVGALAAAAETVGGSVRYLKPHGALYHRVFEDPEQAQAVLDGSEGLPVLAMPGAALAALARASGRRAHTEGFPDRGYAADGRLLPRGQPGALLTASDQIAGRAVGLVGQVESVCVHGDSPGAVHHAAAVHAALRAAGVQIRPFA